MDEESIIKLLQEIYKKYPDNETLLKFNSKGIKHIDENHSITPFDLYQISIEYKIGFILLSNKYSNNYEYSIINYPRSDSYMVLYYHNDEDDKNDYRLGCIILKERYINSKKDIIELSDNKIKFEDPEKYM